MYKPPRFDSTPPQRLTSHPARDPSTSDEDLWNDPRCLPGTVAAEGEAPARLRTGWRRRAGHRRASPSTMMFSSRPGRSLGGPASEALAAVDDQSVRGHHGGRGRGEIIHRFDDFLDGAERPAYSAENLPSLKRDRGTLERRYHRNTLAHSD